MASSWMFKVTGINVISGYVILNLNLMVFQYMVASVDTAEELYGWRLKDPTIILRSLQGFTWMLSRL